MEAVVEEWLGSGNDSNSTGHGSCPGASKMHSEWVLKGFGQCIETPLQYVAFFIGLSSIICWLLAQAPQLITNCRYGIADKALSFWFLLQWFLGDATNLIGAILTHQLATQTATAVYFVFIDTVMMSQFVYYVIKNQGVRGLLSCFKCPKDSQIVAIFLPGLMCTMLLASWPHLTSVGGGAMGGAYFTEEGRVGRVLLEHRYDLQTHKDEPVIDVHDPEMFVGYLIGIISAALYVGSRVPQIVKNFTRCSVDGVSLPMFILAVLGNVTYALGIFLYSIDGRFLIQKLPWIIGSVGTLCFDFTIFSQFLVIRTLGITCGRGPKEEREEDDETRPLIEKSADTGASLPCFSQKGSIQAPQSKDIIEKDNESTSSSDESVDELILSRYELPHHHHHPHHQGHCPPGHHHHEHPHHDHHSHHNHHDHH